MDNFSCDFDASGESLCGMVQGGKTIQDFNLTRHTGMTDSTRTGPNGDHTTGNG